MIPDCTDRCCFPGCRAESSRGGDSSASPVLLLTETALEQGSTASGHGSDHSPVSSLAINVVLFLRRQRRERQNTLTLSSRTAGEVLDDMLSTMPLNRSVIACTEPGAGRLALFHTCEWRVQSEWRQGWRAVRWEGLAVWDVNLVFAVPLVPLVSGTRSNSTT
jgi:hypothetical protein